MEAIFRKWHFFTPNFLQKYIDVPKLVSNERTFYLSRLDAAELQTLILFPPFDNGMNHQCMALFYMTSLTPPDCLVGNDKLS